MVNFFVNLCYSQNFFLVSVKLPTDTVKIFEFSEEYIPLVDIKDFDKEFKFSFDNILFSTSAVRESDIIEMEEESGDDELKDLYSLVEPTAVNMGGDGLITIIRKDTGEKITVRYRNKDGSYNQRELEKVYYISRCSLSGEVRRIPEKLVELIDRISDRFGKKPIVLLSGYRTKPLNDITPGAAKKSLHLIGWAMDIRIDGVSSRTLSRYVRSLKSGGVGYYPRYGFVHVDIGKIRYWERYQYRKKPKYAKKKSTKKIFAKTFKNKNHR